MKNIILKNDTSCARARVSGGLRHGRQSRILARNLASHPPGDISAENDMTWRRQGARQRRRQLSFLPQRLRRRGGCACVAATMKRRQRACLSLGAQMPREHGGAIKPLALRASVSPTSLPPPAAHSTSGVAHLHLPAAASSYHIIRAAYLAMASKKEGGEGAPTQETMPPAGDISAITSNNE